MNLTCPNCGARFKIKEDALGAKGRKVKCGKCEHRWHAMPESVAGPGQVATVPASASGPADPTEDFAPPPPPPPVARSVEPREKVGQDDTESAGIPDGMLADPPPIPPESDFASSKSTPEQKKRGGTKKYWLLLVLLLIGGSSAAFVWRDTVVHLFPPANKVFMMVGFPANTLGYGLKIFEPKTFLDVKGKKRVLGVTGQIINETGKIIEVPLLKAILIGAKGEDMISWVFDAKVSQILPGEKVEYETSTENPPRGATGLRITFTRAEERTLNGDKVAKEKP